MHKLHVKASQARQVADRFHLVQNLRLAIEKQLSRAPRLLKRMHPVRTAASAMSLERGGVALPFRPF